VTAPFAWTHEKTRVAFDGDTLTIDDARLPLDSIDGLARTLSRSTAPGSYNRLDCQVHLFANGKVSSVRFRGDASTDEWGPWRPKWDELDAMIRQEIEPRLLNRTISQVESDSSAEIGRGRAKGRGRVTVTAETLEKKGLFSKPIRWSSIVAVSDGDMEIVAAEPDGKQRKQRLGLHAMEWDAWQIPLLWQHFTRR
jgi:hypothetical protein